MLVEYDRLIPNISKIAPQCPDPTIVAEITNIVRDMCTRLRCWRIEDEYVLTGANPEISIAPDQATIFELGDVYCHGHKLEPVTFQRMHHIRGKHHAGGVPSGRPRYYCLTDSGALTVYPNTEGETLHVVAYLRPSYDADMIPAHLIETYGNEIVSGALSSILAMPEQPWTNPSMAAVHATRYDSQMDRFYARWVQGAQAAPLRVRSQFM